MVECGSQVSAVVPRLVFAVRLFSVRYVVQSTCVGWLATARVKLTIPVACAFLLVALLFCLPAFCVSLWRVHIRQMHGQQARVRSGASHCGVLCACWHPLVWLALCASVVVYALSAMLCQRTSSSCCCCRLCDFLALRACRVLIVSIFPAPSRTVTNVACTKNVATLEDASPNALDATLPALHLVVLERSKLGWLLAESTLCACVSGK